MNLVCCSDARKSKRYYVELGAALLRCSAERISQLTWDSYTDVLIESSAGEAMARLLERNRQDLREVTIASVRYTATPAKITLQNQQCTGVYVTSMLHLECTCQVGNSIHTRHFRVNVLYFDSVRAKVLKLGILVFCCHVNLDPT